jgi:hypothetical protein
MALPINIDDLLNGFTVEWEQLECKNGGAPERHSSKSSAGFLQ